MKREKDFKSLKFFKSSLETGKMENAARSWAEWRDLSGIVAAEVKKFKFEVLKVKVQVIDNKESKNSLSWSLESFPKYS